MRIVCCVAALLLGCKTTEPLSPAAGTTVRLPVRVVGDTGRIAWSVPTRDGQLSAEGLAAVLPRVQRLIAEPDSIAIGLGDSVFIPQHVRFLAVDAAGVVIGELRNYDFRTSGGLGPSRSGAVRSSTLGRATFTASWPRRALPEGNNGPTPATLAVLVTPVAGLAIPPPRATSGTARVSGAARLQYGQPIADAEVNAYRQSILVASTRTDASGRYEFSALPAGVVTLRARRGGYTMGRGEALLAATSDLSIDLVMMQLAPTQQSSPPN